MVMFMIVVMVVIVIVVVVVVMVMMMIVAVAMVVVVVIVVPMVVRVLYRRRIWRANSIRPWAVVSRFHPAILSNACGRDLLLANVASELDTWESVLPCGFSPPLDIDDFHEPIDAFDLECECSGFWCAWGRVDDGRAYDDVMVAISEQECCPTRADGSDFEGVRRLLRLGREIQRLPKDQTDPH
ncbi:unnamed protein product [Clonostachys rhizophaga]|uniref:Uncharacterized protein n=1 Tax=Clonostachys rhizophaga TaxID=160324 RepID=A0A9N9VSI9_9HYPO|nr:unnamed protein product [Clonostachys rhizophaga]